MILDGTIPSIRIHEDDTTLAFMDIHPVQPGHALVIPKAHHPNLFEAPPEVVATTARTAARIGSAIQRALNPPGMNLLQCNGEAAGQSVMHLHMHLIPRAMNDGMTMNWDLVKGDVNAIEAIAERIRTELANDAG
ncbi:MAG: HIT domain-containing protein [Gammaproteobacteria bacterium]|nr:HIT domain-containing protein [Gammaproteobacteria bacterium]